MFRKPTLEQRLVRLEKLARKFEAAGSELIYQDDLWDVYKINSKEAAIKYGARTDWYILMKDDFVNDVFDGAITRSDIYFYIKKKGNKKYCLYKNKDNGSVSLADKSDEDVPLKIIKLEEPKFPSIPGVFEPPAVDKSTRNIEKLVDAIAKGKIDVVNKLIDSGINVNARCSAGTAPLHVAIMYNRIDIVKALLEAGADPNMPGNEKYPGWTNPLKNAISDRRPALVALLKQYGAHE